MRLACSMGILCLFGFALARDFRTDARLAKPISIRLKIAPLSQCAKAFSDATGVGIYVAASLKDRKVTILFKDKPASEAMEMLANTFFCGWTADQSSYRLVMPPEARNEEDRLLDAEQTVVRERLTAVVAKMVEVAARPKDVLTDERDKMAEAMNRLRLSRDPDGKRKYEELRKEYNVQFNWLPWWDVGFALKNAPSAVDSLAAGATIFASTKPGEALPFPASSVPTFTSRVVVPGPDGQPVSETRSPSGAVAAIRVNPATGHLQCRVMGTGVLPAAGSTSKEAWLADSGEAENKLWNLPLRRRLRDWARLFDTDLLNRKLTPANGTASKPGYLANAYTVAEHLEHLADCAGVSVVADAFRLPASNETYFGGSTVNDYVSQMHDQLLPDTRGGSFRTEKGWLMFRHPRYWRLLSTEIPENLLAPLEAKAKAKQTITLDDYAAFATALTPWQSFVFPYRPTLTRFPRLPLVHAMPALRLWGSLTGDQRRTAYDSGIPVSGMDSTQRELYRVAVNELLWIGGINEAFLPILMNGGGGGDAMGLFLQDAQNGANPIFGNEDEGLEPAGPQFRTTSDMESLRSRSFVFAFGSTPQSGASYSIVLRQ
ncbi:MAG: hypothetical protein ACHQ50_04495 [Fimbriimonadales bacterium]